MSNLSSKELERLRAMGKPSGAYPMNPCGYCGEGHGDHTDWCLVGNRQRIAEMEAENARLKGELEAAIDNAPTKQQVRDEFESQAIDSWKAEVERLKADNARLQKQADCPYTHMKQHTCTKCGWSHE